MEGGAIDLNLIPFGLNEEKRVFLDVFDVPRGKKCGCICPSCKTPLIARHGEIKEWHFAHASRNVYRKTENECKFSFYVSVRMMARQIIGEQLEIILPTYDGCVSEYVEQYGQNIRIPFTVTGQQKIALSNIKIEQSFMGSPVDIAGQVGNFSFVVYFSHPGRDIPANLHNPTDTKCGVISVSLNRISRLFAESRSTRDSYEKILRDFLVKDVEAKKWVFHPRYKRCEEDAKHKLQEKKSQLHQMHAIHKKESPESFSADITNLLSSFDASVTELPKRLVNYQCVMCHTTWQDWNQGGSECPKCKTHLYSTLKGYV